MTLGGDEFKAIPIRYLRDSKIELELDYVYIGEGD